MDQDSIIQFRLINTFWPAYPPDWGVRRKAVLKRAGEKCEDEGCGETKDLDIHHILPISKGGSHSLDNLICLCHSCHRDRHGGLTGGAAQKPGIFQRKIEIIQEALDQKQDIVFHYRDNDGDETDRIITPWKWGVLHGVRCVVGQCHLRNAKRTFLVRRMSAMKLKSPK
jgi:hypothetical protein